MTRTLAVVTIWCTCHHRMAPALSPDCGERSSHARLPTAVTWPRIPVPFSLTLQLLRYRYRGRRRTGGRAGGRHECVCIYPAARDMCVWVERSSGQAIPHLARSSRHVAGGVVNGAGPVWVGLRAPPANKVAAWAALWSNRPATPSLPSLPRRPTGRAAATADRGRRPVSCCSVSSPHTRVMEPHPVRRRRALAMFTGWAPDQAGVACLSRRRRSLKVTGRADSLLLRAADETPPPPPPPPPLPAAACLFGYA